MKRVGYCDECRSEREVRVQMRSANRSFRGEPFEIVEQYAECLVCGSEVSDEELDSKTLQKLGRLYEVKHDFNPEALKEIRNSFKLTQPLFAQLLRIGVATVKRYETGVALPGSSQLSLYKLLKSNPWSVRQIFEQSKGNFSPEELLVVRGKLGPYLNDDEVSESSHKILEATYHSHIGTADTGYSGIYLEKLFQMALFFAREGILKTKLMKLFWYADFLHFKRFGKPISGIPYWHKKFGPVPKHHDLVLGCLEGINLISICEEESSEGFTRITINSKEPVTPNAFTGDEMETLLYVDEYFKEHGSRDITEFSHREKGWTETMDEQIIPYIYAEHLQLS